MKCPIDQTEMEKGLFVSHLWASGDEPVGGLNKFFLPFMGRKKVAAIAYRCNKCGKIELTSKVEDKK